ncbi:MAG TPA: GH3 auxin-responsive promoter family protein [Tepidisphaeraceae bacterium]|nr:GH3 auxin-responsive promoter family protein [Tepidisphaeraceae bacterium]
MSAIVATLANTAWWLANEPAYARFKGALASPRRAQEQLLCSYLRQHTNTAFGRDHTFSEIDSAAAFRRNIPIRNYDDLSPYIDRIAAGEANVLTSHRVVGLATSSGSTRARKLIPYTRELQREFKRAIGPWIVDLFRGDPELARGCAYWSITPVAQREGEAPAEPFARSDEDASAGASPSNTPRIGFEADSAYLGGVVQWLVDAAMAVPSHMRHVPNIEDFRRETMRHLLKRRDLRLISVWHPSFLELLLDSVGSINVREVWPNLRLISCWADAHARAPAEALAMRFPGVRIQPKGLLATEAFVTIPFAGHWPLAIRSHFFEFADDREEVRLADDLRLGAEYSVVVTTAGGLWRYRLGDRVRVEGFVDATPSLRFVGREDRVVDRFGEKLSEGFVGQAIRETLVRCNTTATFSMLAPQRCDDGFRYTLFVETGHEIDVKLADRLDARLRANPHYDYCRSLGQLLPPNVFVIRGRAFPKYVEELRRTGQRLGDIKPAALSDRMTWGSVFDGGYFAGCGSPHHLRVNQNNDVVNHTLRSTDE